MYYAAALAFATVSAIDPDTQGGVAIQLFKHQNGGIFGVDASFFTNGGDFELVDPDDEDSDAIILDPFSPAYDDVVSKVRLYEDPAQFASDGGITHSPSLV